MDDSQAFDRVDWPLAEVYQGDNADPQVVRSLIESSDPLLEKKLMEILKNETTEFHVALLASRILVERDPDRDPAFLLNYFPCQSKVKVPKSWLDRMIARLEPNPPSGAYAFGYARLRRLDPIRVYAGQLEQRSKIARICAATALGDSGDLAALNPLAKALEDSSWRVRVSAVESVRRLRHAGAGEVLPTHLVRDALIKCLDDRKKRVRIAAAQALGSMGDLEPVRERRAQSHRDRRELDRVLSGEIPPLYRIWPGDETR